MRTLIRALAVAASALALTVTTGAAATADSPVTLEPFSFQFSERDALMTASCGFPVQATIVTTGSTDTSTPGPEGSPTWAPSAPTSASGPATTR